MATTKRRQLTDEERAERRQREQELTQRAVAQLRSSKGWQRWLTVRARVGLRRYSVRNQLLIALQRMASHCLLRLGEIDIQSKTAGSTRVDGDLRVLIMPQGRALGSRGPSVTGVGARTGADSAAEFAQSVRLRARRHRPRGRGVLRMRSEVNGRTWLLGGVS
jgi:hypothetical protein